MINISLTLRHKVHILLTLLLAGFAHHLVGQEFNALHYNTQDGLPSTETYDIEADSNGIMYICSDRGITTYNGYEFKVFSTKDGISNNTVLNVVKSPDQTLWFLGLDGTLTHTGPHGLQAFKYNDRLVEVAGKDVLVKNLMWDQQDRMYFVHQDRGAPFCRRIWPDGRVEALRFRDMIGEFPNGVLHGYRYIDVNGYYFVNRKLYMLKVQNDLDAYYIEKEHTDRLIRGQLNTPGFRQERTFPGRLFYLYFDRKGDLWVNGSFGTLVFENGDLDREPRPYLTGLYCSSTFEDKEGNIWISTLDQGLYMIPSLDFENISDLQPPGATKAISSIAIGKGHLFYGTYDGEIYRVDSNFEPVSLLKNNEFFGRLTYSSSHPEQPFIYRYRLDPDPDKIFFVPEIGNVNSLALLRPLRNGNLLAVGHTGYHVYGPNAEELIYDSKSDYLVRILSSLVLRDRTLLGTMSGLVEIRQNRVSEVHPVLPGHPLLQGRVNDMVRDRQGNVWLATIGDGLLCMRGDSIISIAAEAGLFSNMINCVGMEKEGVLWAGTNRGLFRIEYESKGDLNILSVVNINHQDGLPTNNIRSLALWKNKVWVATDQGLIYFPTDIGRNQRQTPPITVIDEVSINNEIRNPRDSVILNINEKDISFHYTGVTTRRPPNEPFYKFRLLGLDSTWTYSNGRNARYLNLKPGDYTFEVTAHAKNSDWNPEMSRFHFTIETTFVNTIWFAVLVGVVLLLLLGLLAFFRSQR